MPGWLMAAGVVTWPYRLAKDELTAVAFIAAHNVKVHKYPALRKGQVSASQDELTLVSGFG